MKQLYPSCVLALLLVGCSGSVEKLTPAELDGQVSSLFKEANDKFTQRKSVGAELERSRMLLQGHADSARLIGLTAFLMSREAAIKFDGDDIESATKLLDEAVSLLDSAREKFPENQEDITQSGAIVYPDAAILAASQNKADRCMELMARVKPNQLNLRLLMFSDMLNSVRDRADFKSLLAEVEKPLLDFNPNFSMKDSEGNTVSLADFEGKVVVINLWGTWCPPCRREMPDFVKMQEKHADDLQFVGLTYERGAPPSAVAAILQRFTASNDINYPLLIGEADYTKRIPGFGEFPTTLVVDRTGKLRKRVNGGMDLELLQHVLEPLIAE